MGDVADMLGIQSKKSVLTVGEQAARIMADQKGNKNNQKNVKKPKGMKREVFDLLGEDALTPAVQTNAAPTFKRKRQITSGKWLWSPIESSARTDTPNPIFYHWVKADIHYNDYPYAKYNVQEERLHYTDEEYDTLLKDENWTKEDTDQLVDLAAQFSLRWPVIYDRLVLSQPKPIEQVMARYFHIATQLSQGIEKSLPMHGLSLQEKTVPTDFDVEKEARRRRGQDILFRRTKDDEQEEIRIKEEIKAIDALLKKNKKQAKHTASQSNLAATSSTVTSTAESKLGGAMEGGAVTIIDGKEVVSQFSLTNPSLETYTGPQKNKPCLQSSRLYLSDGNLNLSKSLISKMNSYLKELNIPERPIPTKRVCDLVDQVRKSTVTLVSLHNQIKKKEKELIALKTGNTKGVAKSTSRKDKDAVKTEKVSKPRAPKARKAQPPAAPIDPLLAPSTDLSPNIAPSLSSDANAFLNSKSELVDLLDVFDRNDSFLDEPLDFVIDKKESELSPAKPTKNKRGSRDSNGGTAQPRKRAKKAPA